MCASFASVIVKISFLSRLLFVAIFTFHQQYFRIIWRGLVEKWNLSKYCVCVRMNGIGVRRKKEYTHHQRHHHLIIQLVFIGGYRILFYFIVFRCAFFSLWIGNALVLHDVKKKANHFSKSHNVFVFWVEMCCAPFFPIVLDFLFVLFVAGVVILRTQSWNLFFAFAKSNRE